MTNANTKMELIRRMTRGGYIKTEDGCIGRITDFDAEMVEFEDVTGEEFTIERSEAFKATPAEFAAALAQYLEEEEESEEEEVEEVEEEEVEEVEEEEVEEEESGDIIKEEYRQRYIRATSSCGNSSKICGDVVSVVLQGQTLDAVITIYLMLSDEFDLPVTREEVIGRYSHLNLGMFRMNVGNRIRAIVKNNPAAEEKLTQMF